MNLRASRILSVVSLLIIVTTTFAKYTETMDPDGLTKNMKTDYGLVNDNADSDQSVKLQQAIDFVNAQGGGNIVIPKGTYTLCNIVLKSNVHLLIDAGTVIKPTMESALVFLVSTEKNEDKQGKYIENVSIRGVGGSFVVDYHFKTAGVKQRAVLVKMVKNFLISDMDVKDNYTKFCGISVTPTSLTEKAVDLGWEVTRATDGTIQNIRHFRGHPGYGLVQCHGAQSVHFENLYSLGGVALRLEVGADNINVGVFDITGNNITCENGRMALMMGPHSAKSGKVTVENIKTISCTRAVSCGDGHVKENAPDQTPGWFSSESSVKNIHAIFGTKAQFKGTLLLNIPDNSYYEEMKIWSDGKFFTGPSICAVSDNAESYDVNFENITMEGFPYNTETPILKEGEGVRPGDIWDEKDLWKSTHTGPDWVSDKGVVNEDYTIPGLNTGIKWVENPIDIAAFPNPFKENLYIRGAELEKYTMNVCLLDMMGTTVYRKNRINVSSEELKVNVDDLAPGYYLLTITDDKSNLVLGSSKVLITQ